MAHDRLYLTDQAAVTRQDLSQNLIIRAFIVEMHQNDGHVHEDE